MWEKIAEKMQKIGATTKGAQKKISTWAKGKGLALQNNCQLGGSGASPFMYGMAEKLVLSKVKAALGLEKCKFGFTGAAPISHETLKYFGQLGIQINEVYGMSECTGATTWSTDSAHVWSSCGWAMRGEEVKVFKVDTMTEVPRAKNLFQPTEEEQGEICFRGRHVMPGYMANPDLGEEHVAEITKKNNAAIDAQGWLHSGDKGCIDERGMVKITGRYKDLIIGAGGENVAPVPIEDHIKAICPAISNVMMVGDQRKFNACLVTLKAVGATGDQPGGDELDEEAVKINPKITSTKAAAADEVFIKTITDAILATNKNGDVCPSNASAIQKFTILPFDFSVRTSELTPTFKLKRSAVEAKHLAAIEAMYVCADAYSPYASASEWPASPFTAEDAAFNAEHAEEADAEVVKEVPLMAASDLEPSAEAVAEVEAAVAVAEVEAAAEK